MMGNEPYVREVTYMKDALMDVLDIFADERHFRLVPFYDAGWVHRDRHPASGSPNARTLAGAGVGLIYTNPGRSYARIDAAFPLSDRYSETAGRNIHSMCWFQFVQYL